MIEVKGLSKEFGLVRALDGVSFRVERGAIFGLIGPNGAGKTTCLNILSTLLKPTAGEVWIDGLRIDEHVRETRRKLGFMPDFFGVYRSITAWEYLDFYGGACGVPAATRLPRIDRILEMVRLTEARDQLVDNLSRGMKQRLCLGKALIHEPPVLILDEPASGLDPRSRVEVRDILKEVTRDGRTTVIISSHILSEMEDVCTHIGILEQARLVHAGRMADVLQAARPKRRWRLKVDGDPAAAVAAVKATACLLDTQLKDGVLFLTFDEAALEQRGLRKEVLPPAVLQALLAAGIAVVELAEDKADLEEAFMVLTRMAAAPAAG